MKRITSGYNLCLVPFITHPIYHPAFLPQRPQYTIEHYGPRHPTRLHILYVPSQDSVHSYPRSEGIFLPEVLLRSVLNNTCVSTWCLTQRKDSLNLQRLRMHEHLLNDRGHRRLVQRF